MSDWVIEQNIARFERLLAEATDPAERTILKNLLQRERGRPSAKPRLPPLR